MSACHSHSSWEVGPQLVPFSRPSIPPPSRAPLLLGFARRLVAFCRLYTQQRIELRLQPGPLPHLYTGVLAINQQPQRYTYEMGDPWRDAARKPNWILDLVSTQVGIGIGQVHNFIKFKCSEEDWVIRWWHQADRIKKGFPPQWKQGLEVHESSHPCTIRIGYFSQGL